jgi:hypothetical protein
MHDECSSTFVRIDELRCRGPAVEKYTCRLLQEEEKIGNLYTAA